MTLASNFASYIQQITIEDALVAVDGSHSATIMRLYTGFENVYELIDSL